jgi:hypothetical protein
LHVDRDTKNVPGTPAIFETIMAKIAAASVFVADLSFVGERSDGRPTPNPNVLIEYGYALAGPGSERIVAVLNDIYGKPTNVNLPFNLAHMRFPITYTLAENASEEERKAARIALTKSLEGALRTIFESADYIAQVQTARPPSALEIAALHQQELDLEAEIYALRYGDGPAKVRRLAEKLFLAMYSRTREIAASHDFGIECGARFEPSGKSGSCILRTDMFGLVLGWYRPPLNSSEDAKLTIRRFEGHLYFPGELQGGIRIQPPRLTNEVEYKPTISRDGQLGWAQKMEASTKPTFLNNEALAESCLTQVLNTIRRNHRDY